MISINLDKPRNISYPLGSIRAGKRQFSCGILSMLKPDMIGPDVIVDLLWMGLIHEDPALTVGALDNIIWDWLQKPGNSFNILETTVLEALKADKVLNFVGVAEKNPKQKQLI
jgi:hypothetical protein